MRYLVLLAPFIAAFIALTMRTRTQALVVLFIYLSVEGMLKLLSAYHPVVHIGMDIALYLVLGVWVAGAVARRESRLPRVPFAMVLVLHVAWVMALVFSPYTESLIIGVASWKVHLTMIPLYFLGYMVAEDQDAPRVFLRGITVFWCFAFLLTILQYTGGPGGPFDLGDIYIQRLEGFHEWRPFGTGALPGSQAVFAFLALPFALALVLRGDYRLRDPWIVFTIAGSLIVFFISGGRQVFLGSLIAVLTIVALQMVRGRGRAAFVLLALLVAVVGAWIVVQEYVQPVAQRAIARATDVPEIWRSQAPADRFQELLNPNVYRTARRGGLRLITDRVKAFPFGAGLGRTGSAASQFQDELTESPLGRMIQERYGFADNYFAAMLVETGIPGTIMLTGIVMGLLVLAIRLSRVDDQADAALGALVAGYLVALLVMSWGSQPLLANPTQAFFWVMGGMMARRYHAAITAPEPIAAELESTPALQPE